MDIRVLLLTNEGEAREYYEEALRNMGVAFDTVTSLTELETALDQQTYNGILMDVVAKLKGTGSEKENIHQILDSGIFPVVRLKWNAKKKQIHSLVDQTHNEADDLTYFINHMCRSSDTGAARTHPRFPLQFNLLLAESLEKLEQDPEQTVTVNISQNGMYIYSRRKWSKDDKVWFTTKEFDDDSPICGSVEWYLPWGQAMKSPGTGINFT
ncbi:MAG: hypothetical protein GY869_22465, partial [Planctomycetes bacterium]|nr:hypothetical protein [Planctomycetota bacterium]